MIQTIIDNQKAFFLKGETKSLSYRKEKLLHLKAELIKNEQLIIDALYADFKKPKFESVLSETEIVLSVSISNITCDWSHCSWQYRGS